MPTTREAIRYLKKHGVIYVPGKASNAGGVATSLLEMSQNAGRLPWSFETVDQKLKAIMTEICGRVCDTAKAYGAPEDYVLGANIAGFLRVLEAMEAQGIC